jgi:hypothetical protein
MKHSFASVLAACGLVLLTACGPAPTPTLSAADVANTALAVAFTDIALTQAALPTATPVPPTATFTATFTPAPSPTPFPTVAIASNTSAASDPCNQPPPLVSQGELAQVKLVNKSGGSVNLALGMVSANSFGECGTYNFSLGPRDTAVVTVMVGCYWGYGWVSANEPSTTQTTSNLCFNDPAQTLGVTIGPETIGFD